MSSDLFVILGIVAALLIGGVAIYNKIQERNYRRRAEETFHQRHDDVLLGEESARERDGRIEPKMEPGEIVAGRDEAAESEAPRESERELDRPWLTTLPEVPEAEPWGSNQGMAARSNTGENAETRATDPRKTAPPGGLDEFRGSKAKLYEPPAEPRKTVPPGSLDEPRAGKGKLYEPLSEPAREPRKTIPPGSLRDTSPNSRPPSQERPIPSGRETRTSLSSTHASVPPGSLSGGGREREARRLASKDYDPPHVSLDYVVRLQMETSRPASAFTQLIAQARGLGKPVRFAGLNAVSGDWEEMLASRTYQQVSAGLQLADRSGPASDTDISRFSEMLRRGAVGLKARIQCPPLHQALASAIELDQFCADVDVTIGLNIIARRNEPFVVSRLAQLAEAIGFKLASNGNFEFTAEDGNTVFSLCDQEGAAFTGGRVDGMSTRGVTLLLDVPRVAQGMPAFETMLTLANDLCEALGGVLVDDNGKPLNERGIENIRAQLRDIHDKMQMRQISAGSPRARRLFS